MRIIRQTVDGLERLGTKEWVGFFLCMDGSFTSNMPQW